MGLETHCESLPLDPIKCCYATASRRFISGWRGRNYRGKFEVIAVNTAIIETTAEKLPRGWGKHVNFMVMPRWRESYTNGNTVKAVTAEMNVFHQSDVIAHGWHNLIVPWW
jgi:hypothetical protein